MPLLHPAPQTEMTRQAAHAAQPEVRITIAEDPLQGLRNRIDAIDLSPETRQRAQDAVSELQFFQIGGKLTFAPSFSSPESLSALIALHQIKVIDLNDVRTLVHSAEPMNAIEFVCDYLPPPGLVGEVAPAALIAQLARCGVSPNGWGQSPNRPLTSALTQDPIRTAELTRALLEAGANPLAKTAEGETCIGFAARLNKTDELGLMLANLGAEGEFPERHLESLFKDAIRADSVWLFDELRRQARPTSSILPRTLVENGPHLGPQLLRHLLVDQEAAPAWGTRLEAITRLTRRDDEQKLCATRSVISGLLANGELAPERAQQVFDGLVAKAIEHHAEKSLKGLLPGPRENGQPHALRITDPHELLIELNRSFSANRKDLGKLVCRYLIHTPARGQNGETMTTIDVADAVRRATESDRTSMRMVKPVAIGALLSLLIGTALLAVSLVTRSRRQDISGTVRSLLEISGSAVDERTCEDLAAYPVWTGHRFEQCSVNMGRVIRHCLDACSETVCTPFVGAVNLCTDDQHQSALAQKTMIAAGVFLGLSALLGVYEIPLLRREAARLRIVDFVRCMESELLPQPQA